MICQSKASTFAIRTSQHTDQKLQKSLLCQCTEKNKKSAFFLKNKTLQTHSPIGKIEMTVMNMSLENKEGQLVTKYSMLMILTNNLF